MIPRPTFLMTDPEHFQVAYEINPWMKPAAWSDDPAAHQRAARAGWEALKSALEHAGADVRVMGGVAGLPDLVFPANAAVVLDGKALVARFRFPERAGEAPHFHRALDWLRREGVVSEVCDIEDVFQEGAGDCIWDANRRLFWAASGPRSGPDSLKVIGDYFQRPVVHLPLATEAYYHLDTCFCPLSGGEILYYPPALSEAARRALFEHTTPDQRIEATDADARAFCVNAVSLGRKLIMARPAAALHDRLAERGYDVIGIDLEPFMLSGGGAFCMTLRLDLVSEAAPAVRSLSTAAGH
ncbi:MAG TPA: arginine deiminase-related protein [Caulobacteraceae bacterium]|jgi:N-dimethylarginine dimethylaminohydrolase